MRIKKAANKDRVKIKRFVERILLKIFNSPAKNLEDLNDIEKNFEIFWVVEKDGKIIGTLGIKNEGGARVSRMYIQKSERGKGIGTQLMNKAFDYCKDKFSRIFLTTYPQMNSEEFYKKMGFKVFKKNEQIWMEKNKK